MKLLKKLTTKTVRGKKFEGFDKEAELGAEKTLMIVYGRADGYVHGTNTMPNGDVSEFKKFKGAFAAVNSDTEEECRSGLLILPEVAEGLLAGMLDTEGVESVNFGFKLNVRKTESPIGYEYNAEPLLSDDSVDPLASVRAALPANALPALAAPAPAAPKAEAPKAEAPKAEAPKGGKRNAA
jgi:hypothetical protein